MTALDMDLAGTWLKIDSAPCAATYPAHLRLDPNGLYFGSTEPPGEFTLWDSGTWTLTAPGKLALSTATDAVVSYGYSNDDQVLTFTDASGCRFGYRRDS